MGTAHKLAGAMIAAGLLAGCVNLGGAEPPERLMTLTAASRAATGSQAAGIAAQAIVVLEPDTSQRLDVARVPVQVDDSSMAYLKDAVWVEKPARLFGKLLSETIRAKGTRMVLEGSDTQYAAGTRLAGQLREMTYDAPTRSVLVSFDAVLQDSEGQIRTRRFSAEVDNVAPVAAEVGPALNEAANRVAAEVADWVG